MLVQYDRSHYIYSLRYTHPTYTLAFTGFARRTWLPSVECYIHTYTQAHIGRSVCDKIIIGVRGEVFW